MKLSRILSVVVLSTGALWMGCVMDETGAFESEDTSEVTDSADLQLMGGPWGSTGTNNLPPPIFHGERMITYGATQSQIGDYEASTNTWKVALNTNTIDLLSDVDGRRLLKYIVRCGVQRDYTLSATVGSGTYSFPGQGLLTTTEDWMTTSISLDATEDLFSCLLAHLNSFNVEVPINLSGPSIANVEGADDNFTFHEALWVTAIQPGAGPKKFFEFNVWPMEDLTECPNYVQGLATRVCGAYPGYCALTVRNDIATACTETSEGWYCDDQAGNTHPALLTRLKTTDVELLYDGCTP